MSWRNPINGSFCQHACGDGHRLVALVLPPARGSLSTGWDDPAFPEAVMCFEPLFDGNWNRFPEQSILSVGEDLEIQIIK